MFNQFMTTPTVKHWAALEQILCYLNGAPGLGIVYSNNGHTRVECFADADWAGSKIDRSTTAIVSLWVETCCHREVRNKMLYLDPVQNASIELWHNPHMRLCGYITS